ncbi:MAG: DUF4738 domain-containing protein [Bacteroidaceae bacterium]|nr:DUF4738 domain-containing protein [Bacteroidaceae bacterium]
MNKFLKVGLWSIMLLVFWACKQNNDTPNVEQEEIAPTQQINTPKDTIAESISDRNYTLNIEGKHFDINITRMPDYQAPIVKDVLGTPFYDNLVKVAVNHSGQLILNQTFKKNDFDALLSEDDRIHGTLAGMSVYEELCTTKKLVFATQVCMSGMDGGTLIKLTFSVDTKQITMQIDDTSDLEVNPMSQDDGV